MLLRLGIGSLALAAVLAVPMADVFAFDESRFPDWSGQWRVVGGNRWDSTKPAGLGQKAPLLPEYQAILESSVADQKAGGQGNDLRYRCTRACPG